jgi:hypothetical protein
MLLTGWKGKASMTAVVKLSPGSISDREQQAAGQGVL